MVGSSVQVKRIKKSKLLQIFMEREECLLPSESSSVEKAFLRLIFTRRVETVTTSELILKLGERYFTSNRQTNLRIFK